MSRQAIEGFLFDDNNEEKFWTHRLHAHQVLQILDRPFVVKRNRKGRAAEYVVIGRDDHGQCIAVPVKPTDDPGVWRPVTAWPCKQGEETSLRSAGGD